MDNNQILAVIVSLVILAGYVGLIVLADLIDIHELKEL